MADIPRIVTPLGNMLMMSDGDYVSNSTHNKNHYVYYETDNSTYISLKDGNTVTPTNDHTNWQILCKGMPGASDNNFTDAYKAKVDSAIQPTQANATSGYVGIDAEGNINNPEYINNLAQKIKQIQSLSVYNKALTDLQTVSNGSLNRALLAIQKGTLRVAIWGDSISGIFTIGDYEYGYSSKFIQLLKNTFPNTNITYQNFAIGGKSIYQAVSNNYVGGDTNTDTTFKTSWSVNGKTWHDHIKDFAPDLLIIAFGMNDVQNGKQADQLEHDYLETLLTYTQNYTIVPSIIIVPTILPTTNINYDTQSNNMTNAVARSSRLTAKSHNLAIADANRLFRIVRDGIDENTFKTEEIINFDDYSTNYTGDISSYTKSSSTLVPSSTDTNKFVYRHYDFYSGEITINLTPADTVSQIRYRYTTDIGYMEVKITANATTGSIQLFGVDDDSNIALLGEQDNLAIPLNTPITIKILASENHHQIYCNSTKVIDITTYINLHTGDIGFGSIKKLPQVNSLSIIYNSFAVTDPVYSELDIFGQYNIDGSLPSTGNGINHPSELGIELFYKPAFFGIVNALSCLSDYDLSEMVTYNSSFVTIANYQPLSFHLVANRAIISGTIFPNTTLSSGTLYTIATLPSALIPAGDFKIPCIVDNAYMVIDISATGIMSITPSSNIGAGINISINATYYLS